MDDDPYRCEICGQGGQVIGIVIFGPQGEQFQITVHIACENSRAAKHAERRAKAGTN